MPAPMAYAVQNGFIHLERLPEPEFVLLFFALLLFVEPYMMYELKFQNLMLMKRSGKSNFLRIVIFLKNAN